MPAFVGSLFWHSPKPEFIIGNEQRHAELSLLSSGDSVPATTCTGDANESVFSYVYAFLLSCILIMYRCRLL